jgi:hypothetical protein
LIFEETKNDKLSEQACLVHARRAVFEQTHALVADTEKKLTLADFEAGIGETPVTIPIGTLKGRSDLGHIGVHIKVTMTLQNVDHMYEPKNDEG